MCIVHIPKQKSRPVSSTASWFFLCCMHSLKNINYLFIQSFWLLQCKRSDTNIFAIFLVIICLHTLRSIPTYIHGDAQWLWVKCWLVQYSRSEYLRTILLETRVLEMLIQFDYILCKASVSYVPVLRIGHSFYQVPRYFIFLVFDFRCAQCFTAAADRRLIMYVHA